MAIFPLTRIVSGLCANMRASPEQQAELSHSPYSYRNAVTGATFIASRAGK